MSWIKLEYFINAIHYAIWYGEIRNRDRVERITNYVCNPFMKILPRKLKFRYFRWKCSNQEDLERFFNDTKTGFHKNRADWLITTVFAAYMSFFSFILLGLISRVKLLDKIETSIIIFIPLSIGFAATYKALDSNDKYLKYHKKFKRKILSGIESG